MVAGVGGGEACVGRGEVLAKAVGQEIGGFPGVQWVSENVGKNGK